MSARAVAINAGRCGRSPYVLVTTGFMCEEGALESEYWEIMLTLEGRSLAENRVRSRKAKEVTGKKYVSV